MIFSLSLLIQPRLAQDLKCIKYTTTELFMKFYDDSKQSIDPGKIVTLNEASRIYATKS